MAFEGRTALVTGAGRGIGREIACLLAARGCDVAIGYRQDEAAARETAGRVEQAGRRALLLRADVSDAAQAHGMVGEVLDRWERIDVLVCNAGIVRDGLLAMTAPEDLEAVLRTNVLGVIYPTQAVAAAMVRQRWGRIVNIGSVAGQAGNRGQANYAAAKAGLIGMTKTVSHEVARRGITVNAVAPGFIETDMTRALAEDQVKRLVENVPLGRLGRVEDIAQAVLFLCSPGAAYMTGATLHVNGGMFMD